MRAPSGVAKGLTSHHPIQASASGECLLILITYVFNNFPLGSPILLVYNIKPLGLLFILVYIINNPLGLLIY